MLLPAVAVGLRQGEILGLRWEDVNLETGLVTVRGALQRIDQKLVRVEPKSNTSRRTIQLPAVCMTSLGRHKVNQDLTRKWAGTQWRETGYVFTTKIGTPVDQRNLLRDYYAITRPKPKKEDEKPAIAVPANPVPRPTPQRCDIIASARRQPALHHRIARPFPGVVYNADLRSHSSRGTKAGCNQDG
jgi:integrase